MLPKRVLAVATVAHEAVSYAARKSDGPITVSLGYGEKQGFLRVQAAAPPRSQAGEGEPVGGEPKGGVLSGMELSKLLAERELGAKLEWHEPTSDQPFSVRLEFSLDFPS